MVKNDNWNDPDNILVIAGGGAGSDDRNQNNANLAVMGGSIHTSGNMGSCGQQPGANGGGGHGSAASGAAGFLERGLSGHASTKPQAFVEGGLGADYHWDGGFGGGGGPYNGGGAGGGWSGGSGCDANSSGGGGSLNNGDDQINWSAADPSDDDQAGSFDGYGGCPDGCPEGNYAQGWVLIQ